MFSEPHVQQGAGLIEVMIATTLGLLLLATLLKSYDDSKATFRVQDSLARLQENARYVIHLISRDLRMAGYRGCVRDSTTTGIRSTLNSPEDFLYDFATPIQGHEGNVSGIWTPALPAGLTAVTRGTDVLVLRGALDEGAVLSQAMPDTAATLRIGANQDPKPLEDGDIVMISDCRGSSVFQVTDYTASTGEVAHDTGPVNPPPGNSSGNLGRRYPSGAQLFKVSTTVYYIRDSSNNSGPSLWRRVGNKPGQELVEGVHNMQIQYGVDIDGDRQPDQYLNAAAVSGFKATVSVRIALLFRSLNNVGSERDTRRFTLLDQTVGPFNDLRMYQVITSTITLRNQAL